MAEHFDLLTTEHRESPKDKRQAGNFDMIDVFGIWDQDQLAAFRIWAINPWQP